MVVAADGWGVGRTAHGHSLGVGALDQDGGFRDAGAGQGVAVGLDILGHVLALPFQAIDVLLQQQDTLQRGGDYGERLLGGQQGIEVLQQVGELAGRQLQPGIQGDEVDRLALARAVAGALQGEGAEGAGEWPRVQFGQAAQRFPGALQSGSEVAGALGVEELLGGGPAGGVQTLPEALLVVVQRQAVADGREDEGAEFVAGSQQGGDLVSEGIVCHDQRGPLGETGGWYFLSSYSRSLPFTSSATPTARSHDNARSAPPGPPAA